MPNIFLQEIFYDAPVHLKCSFAWKSILKSRDAINRGAIWRVANGFSIDVWNHRWLLESGHSKIISPRRDAEVSRVHGLIYPDTTVWDPGLSERWFLPWEAEMIKHIHVSEAGRDDMLVWPLTPDGNYSVRSAYRMLATKSNSHNPSSSSPNDS